MEGKYGYDNTAHARSILGNRGHKKGLKLNRLVILWVGIALILLLVLHSIKSIYVVNNLLFWTYVILIMVTVFGSTYYFQKYSFKGCIPVIVISSLIVGLMPYQFHIPMIYDLLFQPGTEVSGISKSFPRPIGITIDIIFYLVPTALIFSLLALGIRFFGASSKKRRRPGSAGEAAKV